jgi:pimeloyl-ACP methyl ester carboxylesterase
MLRANAALDVRDVLPRVRAPALVLHRAGDRAVPIAAGRDLAARLPDARFVELPGVDHLPFAGDTRPLLDEIRRFLGRIVAYDEASDPVPTARTGAPVRRA